MSRFRNLDAITITRTIRVLHRRIQERFPERNLQYVCEDLIDVAEETRERIDWILQPNWYLRIGIVLLIVLIVAGLVAIGVLLSAG